MSPRRSSELTLEHVLLALIDQKPMHGYELYQELCALKGVSLIWNIKQPMLYALLDKLESRGFLCAHPVQGETYPPRKYFELTEIGTDTLHTWLKTPVRRARNLRQEFLAKLIVARRYGKKDALELIRIQQQACRSWQEELLTHIPRTDPEHIDEWIVYSYRISRIECVLIWLQACELEVVRLPDQDLPINHPDTNSSHE